MKRTLIVVIAILGAVPVATGLLAIIGGPGAAPGGEPTNASVDSEYRFVNTFWLAAGLTLWWSLRKPLERALTTRVVLLVASLGGFARLLSVAITGWPHPVFIGTIVLELVIVPLIVLWHARVFPVKPTESASTPTP